MAKPAPSGVKSRVRLTRDGLIPAPPEIQEKWKLKPCDELSFDAPESDEVRLRPIRKRSFFERIDEFKLPPLGRPLTQEEIDSAVAEAMTEKERRSRGT